MRKAIFGGLTLLLVASQAMAGDKVWWVPGILSNVALETIFSCTNGSTASASVTVDVFRADGTVAGSGTQSIAPAATGDFSTNVVVSYGFTPGAGIEVDMGCAVTFGGSARITAPSGVFCAAYLIDPINVPPASMVSLPVIKKTTQKGD